MSAGTLVLLLACRVWAGAQEGAEPGAAAPSSEGPRVRTWLESGPPRECVDVLVVGDGYVREDLEGDGRYWKDVGRVAGRLLETRPFSWYRASFNVRAVLLESPESGCDVGDDDEVRTALDCALVDRKKRLVFRSHERLVELVEQAGGADLVLVLVDVDTPAAGNTSLLLEGQPPKLLPAPTLSARDETSFRAALHALGHSLALLCDEFENDPSYCPPFPDVGLAPGGPNVVSGARVQPDDLPWKHFLRLPGARKLDWCEEGAGRRRKDSYRPWKKCLMRSLDAPFCPVCTEELAKALQELRGEPWDDEAFHREHPLEGWKR